MLRAADLQDLTDASTSLARAEQRSRVRHEQARLDSQRQYLLLTSHLPVVGPCVGRIVKVDAVALLNLFGMPRLSMSFYVGRRGNRQHSRLNQLPSHERSERRLAEAQRQVKPVRDQIADGIAHDQLDGKIRIAREECS